MPYKLYWNLLSQPGRAVYTLMLIGHIDHELVTVDILGGETRTKEWRKINRFGKIPFLEGVQRDNTSNKSLEKTNTQAIKFNENTKDLSGIAQSPAIMLYLCEMHPSIPSHYGGINPFHRARINQLISWYQYNFRPAMFGGLRLMISGGKAEEGGMWKRGYQKALIELETVLRGTVEENQLDFDQTKTDAEKGASRLFLTGLLPSVADLLYFYQITNIFFYEPKKFLAYIKQPGHSSKQQQSSVKPVDSQLNGPLSIFLPTYPLINRWFGSVYSLEEVKMVTMEWWPMAREMGRAMGKL